MLAHFNSNLPFTAIQLESCGRSQFIDPELVLSVFHLDCQSCDDILSDQLLTPPSFYPKLRMTLKLWLTKRNLRYPQKNI